MKIIATLLIPLCFLSIGCDSIGNPYSKLDSTTVVEQEVPWFASALPVAFELGLFPDIEFAKRFNSVLSGSDYNNNLSTLFLLNSYSYNSTVVPTLWFYNDQNKSISCNFRGKVQLIDDATSDVAWSLDNVEFCNGEYPKSGWAPAQQLSNAAISTKDLKVDPATYSLKLSMLNEKGLEVNLSKKITIRAKPTLEQLVKRSENSRLASAPLQLFTTTSPEITQWSSQPISEENWTDIQQKTLVTSTEPTKSIYTTVVVRQAGVDHLDQSNLMANYTLYDGAAVPLLRARGIPVWKGPAIEKDHIRLAQNPLAIEIPQRNTDRYFVDVEVYDLVKGSISELTTAIAVKNSN